MGQTVASDGREIRWNHTIILKETAGVGIQFERFESGSEGLLVRGGPREETFQRRLAPHSELRLSRYYRIYFEAGVQPSFGRPVPGGQQGATVFYRFQGKDDTGKTVRVDVRFHLDPSVGRR